MDLAKNRRGLALQREDDFGIGLARLTQVADPIDRAMRQGDETAALPLSGGDQVRFVITSGTGIREIVDERPGASSANQPVLRLISFKRPSIRIFDQDGQSVSLEKLRRLAGDEVKTRRRT